MEASLATRDRLVLGGFGPTWRGACGPRAHKKTVYLGYARAEDRRGEELGDMLWRVGKVGDTVGCSVEEVVARNVENTAQALSEYV